MNLQNMEAETNYAHKQKVRFSKWNGPIYYNHVGRIRHPASLRHKKSNLYIWWRFELYKATQTSLKSLNHHLLYMINFSSQTISKGPDFHCKIYTTERYIPDRQTTDPSQNDMWGLHMLIHNWKAAIYQKAYHE